MKYFSWSLLTSFLLLWTLAGAEPSYKVFYLGFQPKAKYDIIRDMLSESGKIYWVDAGSIFVKDGAEVLLKIEALLSGEDFALRDQVRVTLTRNQMGESESLSSDIGIEISDRERSISWRGGQRSGQTSGKGETSVVTLSGSAASIALETREAVLLGYRRRFAVQGMLRDGVELNVLPVISGNKIRVRVVSRYWAKTKKGRLEYDTGELNTVVVVKSGQSLEIGGRLASEERRERRNIILGVDNSDAYEDISFTLKAEIIKL